MIDNVFANESKEQTIKYQVIGALHVYMKQNEIEKVTDLTREDIMSVSRMLNIALEDSQIDEILQDISENLIPILRKVVKSYNL